MLAWGTLGPALGTTGLMHFPLHIPHFSFVWSYKFCHTNYFLLYLALVVQFLSHLSHI